MKAARVVVRSPESVWPACATSAFSLDTIFNLLPWTFELVIAVVTYSSINVCCNRMKSAAREDRVSRPRMIFKDLESAIVDMPCFSGCIPTAI